MKKTGAPSKNDLPAKEMVSMATTASTMRRDQDASSSMPVTKMTHTPTPRVSSHARAIDDTDNEDAYHNFLAGRLTAQAVSAWARVQDECRRGCFRHRGHCRARLVMEYYGDDLWKVLPDIFRFYWKGREWKTLTLAIGAKIRDARNSIAYTPEALGAIVQALEKAGVESYHFQRLIIHMPENIRHKQQTISCMKMLTQLCTYGRYVVMNCPGDFFLEEAFVDWEYLLSNLANISEVRKRPCLDLVVALEQIVPKFDHFVSLCNVFTAHAKQPEGQPCQPEKQGMSRIFAGLCIIDKRSQIHFEFLPDILSSLGTGTSLRWMFLNQTATLPVMDTIVIDQSRRAFRKNIFIKHLEFGGYPIAGLETIFERVYLDAMSEDQPTQNGVPMRNRNVNKTVEHIRVSGKILSCILIQRLPTLANVKSVRCSWFEGICDTLVRSLGLHLSVGGPIRGHVTPVVIHFQEDFGEPSLQQMSDRKELPRIFYLNNLCVEAWEYKVNVHDTVGNTVEFVQKDVFRLLVQLSKYCSEKYPMAKASVEKLMRVQVEIWCEEGWGFREILEKMAETRKLARLEAERSHKFIRQSPPRRHADQIRRLKVQSQPSRRLNAHSEMFRHPDPPAQYRIISELRSDEVYGKAYIGKEAKARNTVQTNRQNEIKDPPAEHMSNANLGLRRRGEDEAKAMVEEVLARAAVLEQNKDPPVNPDYDALQQSQGIEQSVNEESVNEEIAQTVLLREKFYLYREMKNQLSDEEILAIEPSLARFCTAATKAKNRTVVRRIVTRRISKMSPDERSNEDGAFETIGHEGNGSAALHAKQSVYKDPTCIIDEKANSCVERESIKTSIKTGPSYSSSNRDIRLDDSDKRRRHSSERGIMREDKGARYEKRENANESDKRVHTFSRDSQTREGDGDSANTEVAPLGNFLEFLAINQTIFVATEGDRERSDSQTSCRSNGRRIEDDESRSDSQTSCDDEWNTFQEDDAGWSPLPFVPLSGSKVKPEHVVSSQNSGSDTIGESTDFIDSFEHEKLGYDHENDVAISGRMANIGYKASIDHKQTADSSQDEDQVSEEDFQPSDSDSIQSNIKEDSAESGSKTVESFARSEDNSNEAISRGEEDEISGHNSNDSRFSERSSNRSERLSGATNDDCTEFNAKSASFVQKEDENGENIEDYSNKKSQIRNQISTNAASERKETVSSGSDCGQGEYAPKRVDWNGERSFSSHNHFEENSEEQEGEEASTGEDYKPESQNHTNWKGEGSFSSNGDFEENSQEQEDEEEESTGADYNSQNHTNWNGEGSFSSNGDFEENSLEQEDVEEESTGEDYESQNHSNWNGEGSFSSNGDFEENSQDQEHEQEEEESTNGEYVSQNHTNKDKEGSLSGDSNYEENSQEQEYEEEEEEEEESTDEDNESQNHANWNKEESFSGNSDYEESSQVHNDKEESHSKDTKSDASHSKGSQDQWESESEKDPDNSEWSNEQDNEESFVSEDDESTYERTKGTHQSNKNKSATHRNTMVFGEFKINNQREKYTQHSWPKANQAGSLQPQVEESQPECFKHDDDSVQFSDSCPSSLEPGPHILLGHQETLDSSNRQSSGQRGLIYASGSESVSKANLSQGNGDDETSLAASSDNHHNTSKHMEPQDSHSSSSSCRWRPQGTLLDQGEEVSCNSKLSETHWIAETHWIGSHLEDVSYCCHVSTKPINNYQADIADLITAVAPGEIANVSIILEQFEGREEELFDTLQRMAQSGATVEEVYLGSEDDESNCSYCSSSYSRDSNSQE